MTARAKTARSLKTEKRARAFWEPIGQNPAARAPAPRLVLVCPLTPGAIPP